MIAVDISQEYSRFGNFAPGDSTLKSILSNMLLIGLMTTAMIGSTTSASAWGCIALSAQGTYGYSYSFDDEDDARDRALNECAARTDSDQTCEITDCDEDK